MQFLKIREKNPFYLFRKSLPQLPINCVGEKLCLLSFPFPIFDLVHVQVILSIKMNSCLSEQLLPGNYFTN